MRRFLVRRAFKIWPAYYIYLAFLAVLLMRTGHEVGILGPFLRPRPELFAEGTGQRGISLIAPHTWSLAVEEHFYLALPLLLLWITPLRRPRVSPGSSYAWPCCACERAWPTTATG